MSPIFVRPVREQLEHDRLIRFLQAKYAKKKLEVGVNVGEEQATPVKIGQATFFPDLVLTSAKKLAGLVEVESGESVNNLEAMAQWVHFSRARVPFHLYVPVHGFDAAKRLCDANHARVSEIWTYRATFDGFDLVRAFSDPTASAARPNGQASAKPASAEKSPKPAARKAAKNATAPARKTAAKAAKKAVRKAAVKKPAKISKAAKPAGTRKK